MEDVGREVTSLADELAERVLRVGAVRVVGGVLARLGAGVLAEADEALGVVERRAREVRGLVREGLVADRAARGVADLVTDGLVAGHGVRVVVAVVGVAMEGGGGRREKGGEGGGRGRKGIHDALAILRAESRVNALRRKCMRWCHSQAGKAG